MLRRPLASVSIFAACAAWSSVAAAQVAVEWGVSGSAQIGYTTNATGTPQTTGEGTEQAQGDGYLMLSPAFRLQLETKRATQTLTYGASYQLFFVHTETSTFNQTLSYGVHAPVSQGADMTFSLTGSQSTTSQYALFSNASQGQATATPGQDNILLSAGAGQGLTVQVAPTVYFNEALAGSYQQTVISDDGDTRTATGSFSLGASTNWRRDTLSFLQSNDLQWSPAQRVGAIAADDSLQFVHRARLDWTHQFSESWFTDVGAGGLISYDVYALETPQPQPVGIVALRFAPTRGNLTISYTHDVAPNLLLRQLTLNDSPSLTGLVTLPRGFDVGGSTSVLITRAVLGPQADGPPGVSFLLDAAVGWIPVGAPVRLEARYQLTRQFATTTNDPDLELFPDLVRHTAMLTTTFAYPQPPAAGGQAQGVMLPPPTASVDVIGRQAPRSERQIDETTKHQKDAPTEDKRNQRPDTNTEEE